MANFKQHPIAIIAYIPYAILVLMVLSIELRIKNNGNGNSISTFEGMMWGLIFISLYAIIYGIVVFINALFKKQSKFYWWLLLAIIIPFIIATALGNFDNITLILQILADL